MGALMGSSRAPDTKLRWRSLPLAVSVALLVLVGGSAVAIFGARIGSSQPRSIGSWSAAAHLSTGRAEPAAALLKDGRVLVAGGFDGRGQPLASAEIYNPNLNRWSPTRAMAKACDEATATVLTSSKVFVVGGEGRLGSGNIPVACVELYDPKKDAWSLGADLALARVDHTATLLRNGDVIVVGDGLPGTFPAEIYDPVANRWSNASQPMQRYAHTATRLLDGRVLIVGGYRESLSSVLIYDASGGSPQLNPVVIGLWGFATFVVLGLVTMPFWRPRVAAWFIRQRSDEWAT